MKAALLVLSLLAAPASAASDGTLRTAVVKIFTTVQKPDYYQPWQTSAQESLTGSGMVIAGNRILTNAHVVSDQTFIEVRKAGEAAKYVARVEFAAHDCELALLRVDDPAFMKGVTPLALGELPRQRDRVAAFGFPTGGDDLSITEGVVSRIEVIEYTHSERSLLAVQTDAAINPGNSGGPVIKDGKLIGVSFQSYSGTGVENIGYVVPVPVIRRFLKDIEDGSYDGVPAHGFAWQAMDSPSLREHHGLRDGETGILVKGADFGSTAAGVLEPGDVLTHVDGTAIANDGTFQFDADKRLLFSHLFSMRQKGDHLRLRVIRDGRRLEREAQAKSYAGLVEGPLYDAKPSYLVYAGVVFVPLTRNYMNLWPRNDVPNSYRAVKDYGYTTAERLQPVVLSYVLPHPVTLGNHEQRGLIVDTVDGRRIAGLADLARALDEERGPRHVIAFDRNMDVGGELVIDAKAAAEAHPAILKRFGIASDRSADLRPSEARR